MWGMGFRWGECEAQEGHQDQTGRGHLRQHTAGLREVGASCARPHERRGGGGSGLGPVPHLAALLVMKANHHDVQDGPPGGAIDCPSGLLHGRPPRARKTTTSTAKGGGPGDPAVPRRAASGGLQVSAEAPHEGRAVRPEDAEAPAVARRPPGPGPRFPHPLPLLPGCHLTRPQPPARQGEAGRGRTRREPDGAGLG